ncbi:unnamed protein product [Urochloa decumbens]|uniref:Uncharacterized protein n=1 Tax=Urochloa decumbens TaxID=240449 RepID=A0ABC9EW16_9POAL
MASRTNTATIKMAAVAGCILLILAASMVLTPVKADCVSACVSACQSYAQALCSGFNSSRCNSPLPLGVTCETVALNPCGVTCLNGCVAGQLAGCIV